MRRKLQALGPFAAPFFLQNYGADRTKWRDRVSWHNCFPCRFSALRRRPSDQDGTFEENQPRALFSRECVSPTSGPVIEKLGVTLYGCLFGLRFSLWPPLRLAFHLLEAFR